MEQTLDASSRLVGSGLLGREADDLQELVGFEAGAAYQGAVDFGLGDKGAEVFGGDAAAVLHLQAIGDRLAADLGDGLADQRDGPVGILRRRGAAGADRPDRLVRDDDRRQVVDAVKRGPNLAGDDDFGLTALLLFETFAHTDDRYERVLEGRLDLAADQRIILVAVLAAFGVAKNDIGREALEHPRGDLTGEGAPGFGVQVLGADGDVGPAQTVRNRRERHERRTHNPFDSRIALQSRRQRVDERQPLGDGGVHLPVAGHDRSARAHAQSLFKAFTPGKTLPSMNSSEAPPPVETWVSLSARPACST